MQHLSVVSLRMVRDRTIPYHTRQIGTSGEAYKLFKDLAGNLDRESVWVMCLDAKGRLTCLSQVSLGTLTGAPARPREVLLPALLSTANSVLILHNHPSGDPTPSLDDRLVTRQLKSAAETLGLKFHDHIIVGDGRYYSFADQGDL